MRKGSLKVSGCESFPAEQINKLSAYIDAETVYGWNEELLSNLRVPDSGTTNLLLQPNDFVRDLKKTNDGQKTNLLSKPRTFFVSSSFIVKPTVQAVTSCPIYGIHLW